MRMPRQQLPYGLIYHILQQRIYALRVTGGAPSLLFARPLEIADFDRFIAGKAADRPELAVA